MLRFVIIMSLNEDTYIHTYTEDSFKFIARSRCPLMLSLIGQGGNRQKGSLCIKMSTSLPLNCTF